MKKAFIILLLGIVLFFIGCQSNTAPQQGQEDLLATPVEQKLIICTAYGQIQKVIKDSDKYSITIRVPQGNKAEELTFEILPDAKVTLMEITGTKVNSYDISLDNLVSLNTNSDASLNLTIQDKQWKVRGIFIYQKK
ncbi:MAG: hypothetical protein QXJ08_08640 [Sulfolobales archaeon]